MPSDARDQVEADGQQQQPPGPRGRRGQPARHAALLRHGRGPGSGIRARPPRASPARLSSRTAAPRAICSLTPVPRAIRSSLPVAPSPAWPRAGRSTGVPFSAPPCGAPPPAAASWFMTYGYRSAASYSYAARVVSRAPGLTVAGRAIRAHACPPGRGEPSPGPPGLPAALRPPRFHRTNYPRVHARLSRTAVCTARLVAARHSHHPHPRRHAVRRPPLALADHHLRRALPSAARRRSSPSAGPQSRSATDCCGPGRPCCRWRRSAR